MAGSPGKPLADKLGLADHQRAGWVGLPVSLGFLALSRAFARSELVAHARELSAGPFDMIHLFTLSHAMLEAELPQALERLAPEGMIWVSWPKQAAKLPTDVTGDVVRAEALKGPLVDVKVCLVDDTWSGLKLVIRKELRG
jgi:hypothetical protein